MALGGLFGSGAGLQLATTVPPSWEWSQGEAWYDLSLRGSGKDEECRDLYGAGDSIPGKAGRRIQVGQAGERG